MRSIFSLLMLLSLTVFAVFAHAQENPDVAKIRSALQLPKMEVGVFIGLNDEMDEAYVMREVNGFSRRIAEIKAEIARNGDDPFLWHRLARFYNMDEKGTEEKAAYGRVETLARAKLKDADKLPPAERGKLTALLGETLGRLEKHDDAEKLLREATQIAPNEWQVWKRFSGYCRSRLLPTLYDKENVPPPGTPLPVVSPERSKRALKYSEDAKNALNRAIALNPAESQLYNDRFMLRTATVMVEKIANSVEPISSSNLGQVQPGDYFTPESRADVRKVAETGETAASKGGATVLDVVLSIMQFLSENPEEAKGDNARSVFTGKYFDRYPQETRTLVAQTISAFRQYDSDPKQKIVVQGLRGMLRVMSGQKKEGMEEVRAAYKARPGLVLLDFDFLIASIDKDYPRMEGLAQEMIQVADSPRHRILLAKVYQNTGRPEKMREAVKQAAERRKSDVLVLLSQATVELQESGAKGVAAANAKLDAIDRLPATEKKPEFGAHYYLLRGVILVLEGKREEGINLIQAVANADKNNEQARDLLAALQSP